MKKVLCSAEKVLSFGPNRTVEDQPNSSAELNVRSVGHYGYNAKVFNVFDQPSKTYSVSRRGPGRDTNLLTIFLVFDDCAPMRFLFGRIVHSTTTYRGVPYSFCTT